MKNKIIILLVSLSTFFMGCNKEYEAPLSFSDIGFMTGLGTEKTLQLGIYNYLTFADLSQGVVDHAWQIEEGNFFIKGPIDRKQTDFESLIINAGDTISNEDIVNVYFKKSGLQKVRLYNVFNDSVTFRGNNGLEDYIMPSKKLGNKWVIDTTFVVKVYDTIVPDVMVKQADVEIDITSKDTVYVEAGDFLNFTDNTTQGEPTTRNWYVRKVGTGESIASSNDQEVDIVMKKLGDFVAGITISRSGENIPGDSESTQFAFPIKVIPSSKPFELIGVIRELEDETIQIPFNGEFVQFFNKEAFFEVKVNDVVTNISSVVVDADDATFINIKLDTPIFQDDEIKVTWLDGSGIMSTDTRTPVTFTDEIVKSYVEEYLVSEGMFEKSLGADWVKPFVNETVEGITEVLIVDAPVGNASTVTPTGQVINLALNRNGGTIATNVRAETSNLEINLVAGREYTIEFKYLVRSGSPNILFRFDNKGGTNQITFNPGAGDPANVDVWKEGQVKFIALTAHQGKFSILSAWSAYADFYIDDIVISSDESRP
ncbi:hypothetical protein [Wenyingzhuangia sp. 2_MG-2023]|uniref:hypothetical protein n=1 Tax=Wenyingzhuangia sp. 2_MG-2023 TaxID=3062639 RepID=UPI0026E402F3|nr:hypothetical protein [Wenyingzhuangia sp. 2_MG-2023]MDO6737225.1 hypothetical protein [Wenyingzhuangia sp. 2_MG-2023]